MSDPNPEFLYSGARAMVALHERQLRSFLETWRRARAAEVTLPETDNPNYVSIQTVLRHALVAAYGYLDWMCEKLELPDPGLEPPPEVDDVEAQADAYLEHLIERWRTPLTGVERGRFFKPIYRSRWGVDYCVDAMLEHAVMHPIRHQFQLENLLREQGS